MFREKISQTINHNFSNTKTINKLVLISFLNVFFWGTLKAQSLPEYTADFETDIRPISREPSSYPPLRSSGNSPQIVTAENGITPRGGTHMMKSVVNRFTSAVNYRTEAVASSYQDFNGEFEKGKEYWLGVSVFIPADWSMDYGASKNGKVLEERFASGIILQFHDRSYLDKSWRYGLPLVVRHTKQGFRILNRADGCGNMRPGQQARPGCIARTPLPQFKKENIPMLLGQWNDFVMHIKWSDRSDGFIDIWVNGKKELEQDGVNYYSEHTKYPYFKMGLYQASYKLKGWSKDVIYNVNERTLYHDELRIGGSESSFEEIAPAGAFIPNSHIGDNPTPNTDPINNPDVTINLPQVTLTVDAGLDKILRCDDSYRTIGGTGTSNNADYLWSTSDGHILSGINSKTAKGSKVGTYMLIVSNADSVIVSDEVVITKESNCATENDNPAISNDTPVDNSVSLVTNGGFESGDLNGFIKRGREPEIITSPISEGTYSAKFTLTSSQELLDTSDVNLPDGDGKYKFISGVIGKPKIKFDFGKEYWINMDYRYEDWKKDSSAELAPFDLFNQPGTRPTCKKALPPAPFQMISGNDKVQFLALGKPLWQGSIEKQKWLNIKIHFKLSSESDGFIEAWKDGTLLGKKTGSNIPNINDCVRPTPPLLQVGIYKWDWKRKLTDSNRRELLIDNLKITEEENSQDSETADTNSPEESATPPELPDNSNNLSSLVSHYTFDNISGNTITDHSNQNHNASIHGATVTTGKKGDALQFDGISQFVNAGCFDVPGQALTLAAWIKADSFAINDARIISKTTGILEQDHYWMLSTIENNGSKLRFRLKTDGQTTTLIGTKNIPVGKWVHVAAVYDGAKMKLFVDRQESGSVNKTGSISTDSSIGVHIGDNPATDNRNFHGAIDDLRVYNQALSTNELSDLLTDIDDNTNENETIVDGNSRKNLIFENGFENGSIDWGNSGSWRKAPANVIPSNNTREGNKSVHFLSANNQKRSELVLNDNKGTYKWGKEYWVGFSINVLDAPDGYNIISQHHSAPHLLPNGKSDWSCAAGGNSFTLLAKNGKFDIRTATNPNYATKFHNGKGNALWGSQVVSKPYQLNKWYDFVLHFKYAIDNTGFMEVWLDGEKVVNKLNTTSVYLYDMCEKPKAPHQYQKIGLYYGNDNKAGEILYDAFRVGNSQANYADVAPGE